jgi:iron complex outermembrane receptor protein
MNVMVHRLVRLAIALGAMPLAVQAQEAGTDDLMLDEVVVTAQKREESLREVPISVEVVSGERLADAGILRMDDLKAYVPNLQMSETGIANNIYIRGIGSGLNQGFEQSVSIYADGIYRGRGHQSRMPFLDLARVEVLRGPQPILFGKNAVSGAVNLVAAHPGDVFEASIRGSRDFSNQDTVASVVLSGPLSDRVGARVAVHHRNADGYVEDLTSGGNEPQRDELGARLIVDFDVTDDLSLSWRTETGSYNTRGRQIEIFGETPISSGPFFPVLGGRTYSQVIGGPTLPQLNQGQHPSALNNTIDYRRSTGGDRSQLSNFETAVTAIYQLPSDISFTALAGYSGYKLNEACDCDFTGATLFTAGITEDYDQTSLELRLASAANENFSWIGGVFFQDYDLDETDNLYVPTNSLVIPVLALSFAANPGLPGGTPQARAALAQFFSNAANPRVFGQDSKLYSAFAQGSWNLSEVFKVTAGGRYSHEKKNGSRVTRLTSGIGGPDLPALARTLFGLPQTLRIIPHTEVGSRTESSFSPLINLQYNIAPQTMTYLSWSRGFKSGGFDARSNQPVSAGGTFEFEDERATTYELGMKSGLGSSAEINANVFLTDYKDLQTSAFDGAIGFNVGNGTAQVKGLEVEGRWRVVRGLTLSGSFAYLDFEWKEYFGQCYFGATPIPAGQPGAGNCNYAGASNQLAPKYTGVIGGNYAWTLPSGLALSAGMDLVYSSKYLQSLTLDPVTTQSSFTKLNARVALISPNSKWEVALLGRNLTDRTTVSYAGDAPLAARLFGARSYYGFVDPPRSIAVEVKLQY